MRIGAESVADHRPDLAGSSQLPANDSCCAHRQGLPLAEIAVIIPQNRQTQSPQIMRSMGRYSPHVVNSLIGTSANEREAPIYLLRDDFSRT